MTTDLRPCSELRAFSQVLVLGYAAMIIWIVGASVTLWRRSGERGRAPSVATGTVAS